MNRVVRCFFLFSPVFVCAVWAVAVAVFDRSQVIVVLGFSLLGASLALHTYQEIVDYQKRNGRRP